MRDKLDKLLGLADSREQIPDDYAQRLKYLQLRQSIPEEKNREIWRNILKETSSPDSKPESSGSGSILELFRQRKMAFAGIGFLVFLCAGLLLLSRTSPDITVASLNGNILINGKAYTQEVRLKGNETLETPDKASAKLLLGKGNVVFLDSGTRIILGMNENSFSRKVFRMDRKVFRMNLVSGRIGAVLNNKKAFSGYQITAPLAVFTVKGTSFFIDASVENSTYLCICNGSLEYHTSTIAQPKSIVSGHHKALEFTLEGNTIKANSGTLKYHDDRYMDYIAGLINEKIHWGE